MWNELKGWIQQQQDKDKQQPGTNNPQQQPPPPVIDAAPPAPIQRQRLPVWRPGPEFVATSTNITTTSRLALTRILRRALDRVIEPPTLHFLAASAGAVVGIAALEGTLLCHDPWWNSLDAARFVTMYSVHQLVPSIVWGTQDAAVVCVAYGLDPDVVLRSVQGGMMTPAQAAYLELETNLLASSRQFVAGFMMIAQLIRAATVSMGAISEYEQRIQLGQEPPLLSALSTTSNHHNRSNEGLILRLCGRDSHCTEISLQRMQHRLFPVFEEPQRVQFLVQKHSEHRRRPVYWCVPPGWYGSSHAWQGLPVNDQWFITINNNSNSNTHQLNQRQPQRHQRQPKLLILEADATNGNDPLALGETALDLTFDDASQGFRRILERFASQGYQHGIDFDALRVYLGNSMETATTGGGYKYTLRHRVRYTKEVDVLMDSRAAVLHQILNWCDLATKGQDDTQPKQVFFQTSSRAYFVNLQQLLRHYGYEIYDPLDIRMLDKLREDEDEKKEQESTAPKRSLLGVMMDDPKFIEEEWEDHAGFLTEIHKHSPTKQVDETEDATSKQEEKSNMLQRVAKMKRLPRLVHMKTTAETVNAVEALIWAGEVDNSNCCALIDRHDGVAALERTLQLKASGFVQKDKHQWWKHLAEQDDLHQSPQASLQIICSSSIHADSLRQIRTWARMGFSAVEIQQEIDAQYHEILTRSHSVQQEVRITDPDIHKEETAARPPDEDDDTPGDAPPIAEVEEPTSEDAKK